LGPAGSPNPLRISIPPRPRASPYRFELLSIFLTVQYQKWIKNTEHLILFIFGISMQVRQFILANRSIQMSENVEPLIQDEDEDEGKRQRSTIAFPYTDYENAAKVAVAIHSNVGRGSCSQGQLSAWMSLSSKSSGFRLQLSAARLFGLIESESTEVIRLTQLGTRVVDSAQARAAKTEAFLQVPLFKALYDNYRDGVTPPAAALEREIAGLGVSEKQKARARQVFENSAEQTGFREAGPNRLVMPAVVVPPPQREDDKNSNKGGGGSEGGGDGLSLDPLLMALLRKIPKAGAGLWPSENRLRWFRTFAMNVSQVYDDDSKPVELDIKLKIDQNTGA
jgi:hypothetical protein